MPADHIVFSGPVRVSWQPAGYHNPPVQDLGYAVDVDMDSPAIEPIRAWCASAEPAFAAVGDALRRFRMQLEMTEVADGPSLWDLLAPAQPPVWHLHIQYGPKRVPHRYLRARWLREERRNRAKRRGRKLWQSLATYPKHRVRNTGRRIKLIPPSVPNGAEYTRRRRRRG